jgi:two-component system chemotaxis response regulator CheY
MPKAMIVDDSPSARAILAGILEELGYDVREASDGREALALVEQDCDLSLFLVDWSMPEIGGLEFVKRLRADARFRRIPVIMITAETDPARVTRALEAGVNEYVMKPFTKDAVEAKLRIIWDAQFNRDAQLSTF